MSILDLLEPIAAGLIADFAESVDRNAAFPTESIAALAAAGLLGVVTPAEHGGLGLGFDVAARVVNRLARSCGTTAMVTCMHYSGAAVLAKYGSAAVNQDVAGGRHLSTLAFSEAGSRSHFWAPMSTARAEGDAIVLDAQKSWTTSARAATAYVWSSTPVTAEGASTIWLVPGNTPGIDRSAPFDGLGLRGNESAPVRSVAARIPLAHRLGPDGGGFDIMMGTVLPLFNLANAGCAIGLAEAATERACAHAVGTRHAHLDTALRDLPTIRAYLARMRVKTDMARAHWEDAMHAVMSGRADALLRVLEVKVAAGETAGEVTTLAMRVCGGAAYRKDIGVERYFRDAQAMGVMAPTSDVLYEFIGKAITGMELF